MQLERVSFHDKTVSIFTILVQKNGIDLHDFDIKNGINIKCLKEGIQF